MTSLDAIADGPSATSGGSHRIPAFGRLTPHVTVLGIFLLSVVSWWLLGDPKWSISKAGDAAGEAASLSMVGCFLFWIIIAHVFTGFTFGRWPFNKLPQPLSGVAQIVTDLVIGAVGALLWTRGVGVWDPTFSANAAGGAGYTAAAFIVLIGFYAYAFPAANLGGYPFETLPSPTASYAQWLQGAFLTTVGTVALIYPNFNSHLAAHAPIGLPNVTGWIYSSIVIVIVSAQVWGNWPWSAVGGRHSRAALAFASTLAGGYMLMLAFEQVLHVIVPDFVLQSREFPIALETAQLGVCFAVCSLICGLIVAPVPATTAASRLVRTIGVTAAAIALYAAFMRFFATAILHFPALHGAYGGNPLLWIDWMILLVLWHAVAFEGYFSTRSALR